MTRATPATQKITHQTGREGGSRLAQGLAAHAHKVGRLSRGRPRLSCHGVWKEVPPCRVEKKKSKQQAQGVVWKQSTIPSRLSSASLLPCSVAMLITSNQRKMFSLGLETPWLVLTLTFH